MIPATLPDAWGKTVHASVASAALSHVWDMREGDAADQFVVDTLALVLWVADLHIKSGRDATGTPVAILCALFPAEPEADASQPVEWRLFVSSVKLRSAAFAEERVRNWAASRGGVVACGFAAAARTALFAIHGREEEATKAAIAAAALAAHADELDDALYLIGELVNDMVIDKLVPECDQKRVLHGAIAAYVAQLLLRQREASEASRARVKGHWWQRRTSPQARLRFTVAHSGKAIIGAIERFAPAAVFVAQAQFYLIMEGNDDPALTVK